MPSNTSLGLALKGSKLRMQQVANDKNLILKFSKLLNEKKAIKFISPLQKENYKEYKLNQKKEILKIFSDIKWGYNNEEWKTGQPQWDGIATSADGNTLYLIEAKSHPKEMKTKCKSKSIKENGNKEIIEKILKFTFNKYNKNNGVFSSWMNKYYQFANRIAFLELIKNSKKFKNVKLVLLNFVDDITMEKLATSKNLWKIHYQKVLLEMTGNKFFP